MYEVVCMQQTDDPGCGSSVAFATLKASAVLCLVFFVARILFQVVPSAYQYVYHRTDLRRTTLQSQYQRQSVFMEMSESLTPVSPEK